MVMAMKTTKVVDNPEKIDILSIMKDKSREDWTFDELVDYCCQRVLEELMNGKFRSGVYTAVNVACMWHEDQLKKGNK